MTPAHRLREMNRVNESGAPSPAVAVFADLHIVTDEHRLHLVGDGRSLVLHSSDPRRLAAALRGLPLPAGPVVSGRRAVGRAANTLRDNGMQVAVRGPDGALLHLGDGHGSRLGRLLTGSPAVSFGTPRELAAAAGIPVRAITLAAIAGGGVAAAVLAGRAWRRR
jgi:hypothetical protein